MPLDFLFFLNSALLGVGLAMDAFSVSLANGLGEPDMSKRKVLSVAGMFAFFQALMPMIGWICVHTVVRYFSAFQKFVPWIALLLLLWIGGKMLFDGIRKKEDKDADGEKTGVGFAALVVQGIATSIDALSVGFTIAEYDLFAALVASVVIAAVTFVICLAGVYIGKKFGTRMNNAASIVGGIILILIGIEIFVTGVI